MRKKILQTISLLSLFGITVLAIPLSSVHAVSGISLTHQSTNQIDTTLSKYTAHTEVDGNDNIVIAGSFLQAGSVDFGDTVSQSVVSGSTFFRKTDSNGSYDWHLYQSDSDMELRDIEFDSQNNIYMVGCFDNTVDFDFSTSTDSIASTGTGGDGFLVKYDSDGNYLGKWIFEASIFGCVNGITVDNNNNLFLQVYNDGGGSSIDIDPGVGVVTRSAGRSFYIVKLDSNADYLDSQSIEPTLTIGGSGLDDDFYYGGIEYANGNIYTYSTFDGSVNFVSEELIALADDAYNNDIFITSLTTDLVYNKTDVIRANTTTLSIGDIAVDSSGNIYALPYFSTVSSIELNGTDTLTYASNRTISPLVKINSDGSLGWHRAIIPEDGGTIYGNSVTLDSRGYVYAVLNHGDAGTINLNPTGSDNFTISGDDPALEFISVWKQDGSYLGTPYVFSAEEAVAFPEIGFQSDNDLVAGFSSDSNSAVDANNVIVSSAPGIGVFIFETAEVLQELNLYRFFNTDTGTHFYTASTSERDKIINTLPQFQYERDVYKIFDEDGEETVPVYRFFNTDTGAHFYTRSVSERDKIMNTLPQFQYEGAKFYVYSTAAGDRKAVYRFFNTDTGTHFYTSSTSERDKVINTLPQFIYERIEYYVPN